MFLIVLLLPSVLSLECLTGFEAKIEGTKEFEIKSYLECPPTSKFCISGLNNMSKNIFLVGFTEMRVWGCEGEMTKYTSDYLPLCKEEGWILTEDNLRYCCSSNLCNDFNGTDPIGLTDTIRNFKLEEDYRKYYAL